MANIIKRNIGKPNSLLVTNASIIRVESFVSASPLTRVSARAPAMNPYFSSAIAEETSSFRTVSIRCSSLSRVESIVFASGSLLISSSTSLSRSSSFMARYLGEK